MIGRMNIFSDSTSSYEDAKYVISGIPFDGTSCFRKGSRLAPQEIRKNSYNFESYLNLFDIDMKDIKVHDMGNLEVTKNIDDTIEILSIHTDKYLNDGKIPIMLGGEHSLTLPFVRSCKTKYPDMACVVLDAHLDLREKFEGEINSHACISRHIIEDVTSRYISIGIRSGSYEEYRYVKENKIKMYSADDVFSIGIEDIIIKIEEYVGRSAVYLSIDMDVIDPAYAPAVGTPEPYGLTPRDIRTVITSLSPYIIGFDLVEITPSYDSGNTALLGARIVKDFIASNAKSKNNFSRFKS